MKNLRFSVDAALLRELGERLVGKPHIALAELVKNAYDADASTVEIEVGEDFIEVTDDGHGMTEAEFRDFFMRIGSPHKEEEGVSRSGKRALTGSKGVGRLSVQFLAATLELTTHAGNGSAVRAVVDWRDAVSAKELTSAAARYEILAESPVFAAGSSAGTRLRLGQLRHAWSKAEFESLAREIWSLQPPLGASESGRGFEVSLRTPEGESVPAFDEQMGAWLQLWHAKVAVRSIGPLVEIENGERESGEQRGPEAVPDQRTLPRYRRDLELLFRFNGEEAHRVLYSIEDCPIDNLSFEIRFFHLKRRQRYGIGVAQARDYLQDFGGVHVYDAGFHLPYYGSDTDWLGIEIDHAHRLSLSRLLPRELQVEKGLNFLPTNSRIFGVVAIDTSAERRAAEVRSDSPSSLKDSGLRSDSLQIQISRDRLIANEAFEGLRRSVRWSVDYYAQREAERSAKEAERKSKTTPLPETLAGLTDAVDKFRSEMPAEAHSEITKAIEAAVRATEMASKSGRMRSAALATLASAGMAALALQHETDMYLSRLEGLLAKTSAGSEPEDLHIALQHAIESLRGAQTVFSSMLSAEDRETRARLTAGPVVESVLARVQPFLRRTPVDTSELRDDLLLPAATMAEWTALFQNAIVNSVNAMLDSTSPVVRISSRVTSTGRPQIRIEDVGEGIDISQSEELFEPFKRASRNKGFRGQLGLGGTGLGLSIVRLIAANANAVVRFVEPDSGFSTCLSVEWGE